MGKIRFSRMTANVLRLAAGGEIEFLLPEPLPNI